MSDKIRTQHLARKAMLYVRQSSAYQVSHNPESQHLQYAMRLPPGLFGTSEMQHAEVQNNGIEARVGN